MFNSRGGPGPPGPPGSAAPVDESSISCDFELAKSNVKGEEYDILHSKL